MQGGGHMDGSMSGAAAAAAGAPTPSAMNGTSGMGMGMHRRHMMMHMTFFWGSKAEVLFSGWPGNSAGMYVVSLFVVFILAFVVEWLSNCKLIRSGMNDAVAGIAQTGLYAVRVGLGYLVMLAVMSFNGGVFLAAIAGHVLGFFLFGSRVFKNNENDKNPDLPPVSCGC